MLSKNVVEKYRFSILGKTAFPMLSKKLLFRSTLSNTAFSIGVINSSNPVGKVHVFHAATSSKNEIEKVFESDCASSLCHVTHTHHRHKQPRRMRACALVELVGLVGLACCQSIHLDLLYIAWYIIA